MKRILVLLSVLMISNVYAEAVDVKQETLKEDKDTLMRVLEKGQCGQVCVRYERNINGDRYPFAFGFCRVSVNICKD